MRFMKLLLCLFFVLCDKALPFGSVVLYGNSSRYSAFPDLFWSDGSVYSSFVARDVVSHYVADGEYFACVS